MALTSSATTLASALPCLHVSPPAENASLPSPPTLSVHTDDISLVPSPPAERALAPCGAYAELGVDATERGGTGLSVKLSAGVPECWNELCVRL